jgi:predicted ATP-dependent serine protease
MRLKHQNDAGVTNIKDVVVPASFRKWIDLGGWLNRALGGKGGKCGQSILLCGGPGGGKTTLLQMTADALTKRGYLAVFVLNEEAFWQAALRFEELGLESGYYPMNESDPAQITAKVDVLRALPENAGKTVVVIIDSLQTLNDRKYGDHVNSKTPVRCLEHMTEWGKETGAVVITIGQVTKGEEFAGTNALKHLVDSFGYLRVDRKPKSPTFGYRCLWFEKNRFGGVDEPIVLTFSGEGKLVEVGEIPDLEEDED